MRDNIDELSAILKPFLNKKTKIISLEGLIFFFTSKWDNAYWKQLTQWRIDIRYSFVCDSGIELRTVSLVSSALSPNYTPDMSHTDSPFFPSSLMFHLDFKNQSDFHSFFSSSPTPRQENQGDKASSCTVVAPFSSTISHSLPHRDGKFL